MTNCMQTLTRTISSDTIAATTAYASLFHLALHDYNFAASVTDKLSGSLSLAAAIFASVLLASRLPTALQVFSQARAPPPPLPPPPPRSPSLPPTEGGRGGRGKFTGASLNTCCPSMMQSSVA